MIIKHKYVLVSIAFMFCLSASEMTWEKKNFTIISRNTGLPLEIFPHGQRQTFQTRFIEQEQENNVDATIYESKIAVLTHGNSEKVHFHVFTEDSPIHPIEIDKEFIRAIIARLDQKLADHIIFEIKNPANIRGLKLGTIKITKETCNNALKANPIPFAPQVKRKKPQQQNKPQKVCIDDLQKAIDPYGQMKAFSEDSKFTQKFAFPHKEHRQFVQEHPGMESKKERKFFKKLGNNTIINNELCSRLYGIMERDNTNAKNKYYIDLMQEIAPILKNINKLSNEQKDDNELNEKQKASNELANHLVYHYWQSIADNKDLDQPSFEKYGDELKKAVRTTMEKSEQDGVGTLFNILNDITSQGGIVIKKQQDEHDAFTKAAKKLNEQNNNQFKQDMLGNFVGAGGDVIVGVIARTTGKFAASYALSFVDDSETIEKRDGLKEKINEAKKELDENSLKNITEKHNQTILKETRKNKLLFDSINANKLTREQLLQELKDLYAQPN